LALEIPRTRKQHLAVEQKQAQNESLFRQQEKPSQRDTAAKVCPLPLQISGRRSAAAASVPTPPCRFFAREVNYAR
jgi:hypothetical protein